MFFLYLIFTLVIIPFGLIIPSLLDKSRNYFDILTYISLKLSGIKHKFLDDKHKFIQHGIILSNHRSWFDFPFDGYYTKCCFITRVEAQYAMLFAGLIQFLENRIISFSRGKVSRDKLFAKIKFYLEKNLNSNVLFYPEGTRSKHLELNTIEETKKTLKPGLLKSIYEDRVYAVQIFLSKNKEIVLNEKKLTFSYGVTIYSVLSDEIHPKDFNSFEEFYNKIADDWFFLWNKVYKKEFS